MSDLFSTKRLNARIIDVIQRTVMISKSVETFLSDPENEESPELLARSISEYSISSEAMIASLETLIRQITSPDTDTLEVDASGDEETGFRL